MDAKDEVAFFQAVKARLANLMAPAKVVVTKTLKPLFGKLSTKP